MRIKKKGLALWLALFLGVSSLSGCGGGDDQLLFVAVDVHDLLGQTARRPSCA